MLKYVTLLLTVLLPKGRDQSLLLPSAEAKAKGWVAKEEVNEQVAMCDV